MSDYVLYFLPVLIGFWALAFGLRYRNYVLGLFGGFIIMSTGVALFIAPLPVLSPLLNDVIGSALFGVGAYIFVVGSVDEIIARMN